MTQGGTFGALSPSVHKASLASSLAFPFASWKGRCGKDHTSNLALKTDLQVGAVGTGPGQWGAATLSCAPAPSRSAGHAAGGTSEPTPWPLSSCTHVAVMCLMLCDGVHTC